MRAGIREDESVTMARFLSGLSLEMRDKVELLLYMDFHDLVQICIKVEQQVLRKGVKNRLDWVQEGGELNFQNLFTNMNCSWNWEWKFLIQSLNSCNSGLSSKQSIMHNGNY